MNDKKIKSSRFPFAGIEHTPGFLLWQGAMCWQRNINKTLAEHSLTYTQFVVLLATGWLQERHDKVYQHQVARVSRIDRMMTSRIMASLEKKNFVERIKQSEDARTNLVLLTESGEGVLTKSLAATTGLEEDFFGPTNKVSEDFIKYMQSMLPDCEV